MSDKEGRQVIQLFKSNLRKNDVVVLSGSLPGKTSVDVYKKIINASHRNKVVLDVSGSVLKKLLPSKPYLIKPNVQEAEECLNRKLTNQKNIVEAVYKLNKLGAKNVILSRGAQGAVALIEGDLYKIVTQSHKGGHAVGCGDVLLATYLAHSEKGVQAALAKAIATATASMKCLKPGFFYKKDIVSLA